MRKGGQVDILPDGTEVVVLEDGLKGSYGVVVEYQAMKDQYVVHLPEIDELWMFTRDEIEPIDEEDKDGGEDELETPGFGMDSQEFAVHLEFLLTRVLDRVPTVGPRDVFFGYQEFEGLTAEDALLALLDKVEEGMAHLAQAHILISRIGVAYRTIVKEITDAQDDNNDDE